MKKQIKTNYKLGCILLLIIMLAIMHPTISKANLQSRPGAPSLVSTTASNFFLLCRQMETSGGPLGLSATIEVQDNKVKETSDSNGIDVHMIKNTEYGTAAMLAASAYGECPSGYSSSITDSTTGNDSGIMQMAAGKYEYVAGIYNKSNSYNTYIYNADDKYKNVYNSETSIPGDATLETKKWKGASNASFVASSYPVFLRSYLGVFNYYYSSGLSSSGVGSRAAVVCGAGL